MTDTRKTALPLFYRNPVAINSERHRQLTVGASPNRYSFAAGAHSVMLSAVEIVEACRDYPVVFAAGENDTVTPLALLGVEGGENLFVDGEGAWHAGYIPAYVRRYPFIPAETGTKELPLCIDQDFDGLATEGGQRLFTEEGEPTEYCRHVQAFVLDFQNQHTTTLAFTAKLRELGLLRALDAKVEIKDGRQYVLKSFLVVDENLLARLDDAAVLDLFRSGQLRLIYAHLASVKNLARLAELKSAR